MSRYGFCGLTFDATEGLSRKAAEGICNAWLANRPLDGIFSAWGSYEVGDIEVIEIPAIPSAWNLAESRRAASRSDISVFVGTCSDSK